MAPSKPFIFIRDMPGRRAEILALAGDIEAQGFPGVMSPSSGDNLALSLAILDCTERITAGTGIANIYTRHPSEMASAASLIEELHPGRFILGIGVSHPPNHRRLGVDTGKPLADTRRYVESLRSAWEGVPHPKLMLAALRQRMTRLAGEISEGVMWANGVRSHLAWSLAQLPDELPDGFIVSNIAPACVDEDRNRAREAVRRALIGYMKLQNYQNYFIEAGYEDEVRAGSAAAELGDDNAVLLAISDRMVDDICIYGTPTDVREQFAAWLDAGVTHMALAPTSASDLRNAQREVMAAFA